MAGNFSACGRNSLLSAVQQSTMDGVVHVLPREHALKEEQKKSRCLHPSHHYANDTSKAIWTRT